MMQSTDDLKTWHGILRRVKLSTLMVSCFIAFNVCFLTVIVWLAYQAFASVTFTEISKARLALLNESTKRGFDFVTNVNSLAYSIASSRELIERLEEPAASKYDILIKRREISQMLLHLLVIHKGVSSIEVYSDAFNELPGSSAELVYPLDGIAAKPWYETLKRADSVWVSLPDDRGAGPALVGYAQHLFDSRGETIGYVLIRLSRENVMEKFSEVPMGSEEQVLLVDTAGNVIMQINDPAADAGEPPRVDSGWLREHSAGAQDGYEIVKKDKESYLAMFSRPSTLQWRLVQTVPTRVLLEGTRSAGWRVLVIGILSLLLCAIFACLFVLCLISPLRKLISGMKRLERGDFNAQVHLSFTEEYAQLAHGFNHMAARLMELMDGIKRESRAKREAETSLLEAQIKPHFLYNTLDMIHWRALDYQANDISAMILSLSKLLRIGLSGGRMFIRVRDELEHARCYVGIQQERLPFAIEYSEAIDPAIRSCYIPKVILQPLIENAVIHGKPHGSAKLLRILVEMDTLTAAGTAMLQIRLSDNGCGLPEGWRLEDAQGIGLCNVDKRIQLYCGQRYGLRIANGETEGTQVTILLPVIETEEQLKLWLHGDKA